MMILKTPPVKSDLVFASSTWGSVSHPLRPGQCRPRKNRREIYMRNAPNHHVTTLRDAGTLPQEHHVTIGRALMDAATCAVCGADLPARCGPRARVYCSRACQQQ